MSDEKPMAERLAEPFPASAIEWRAGSTNAEKTRCMALAYLTSRAVMDRLDAVCGPENWQDEYEQMAPFKDEYGMKCRLSIRIGGEWVTKEDGAATTDIESIKGGFSDAFKRAAVKWGIGRYLYGLPSVWHECERRGNSVVMKGEPTLPAWALPCGSGHHDAALPTQAPKPRPTTPARTATTETGGGTGASRDSERLLPMSEDQRSELTRLCEEKGIQPKEKTAICKELKINDVQHITMPEADKLIERVRSMPAL